MERDPADYGYHDENQQGCLHGNKIIVVEGLMGMGNSIVAQSGGFHVQHLGTSKRSSTCGTVATSVDCRTNAPRLGSCDSQIQ